jgi:hypothetical protein
MPDFHLYEPPDVDVEIEIDGQWWPGEARMRTTHEDGRISTARGRRTSTGSRTSGCGSTRSTAARAAARSLARESVIAHRDQSARTAAWSGGGP